MSDSSESNPADTKPTEESTEVKTGAPAEKPAAPAPESAAAASAAAATAAAAATGADDDDGSKAATTTTTTTTTTSSKKDEEKPAVVSAAEEEEEDGGIVPGEAKNEVPDNAIHEKLFLQIYTDDKRMFHLPYATAVRSQRLKEIIEHERENINAQRDQALFEFDSKSNPNAHSFNVVLQSGIKLDGRIISEDAYIALCTYFELSPQAAETDPRLVAFEDFDQLADRIIAFEYMGIEPMTLRLSRLLHKLLMDSHSPDEARIALKINDYGEFASNNPFFLSAFGPAAGAVAPAAASADGKKGDDDEEEAAAAAVGAGAAEEEAVPAAAAKKDDRAVPRRIQMRRNRVKEFPDSDVCMHCSVRLQLPLKPKYVCRACGGSFCGDHCSNTIALPFDPIGEQPRTSLFGFVKSAVTRGLLVCNECYRFLSGTGREQDKYFRVMRAAALPVVSARRAGTLSMALSVAASAYLNLMRVLQNRLPCQSFSPIERRMMLANKRTFAGHSLWTLQMLRAFDYGDPRNIEEARALMHADRIPGGISTCSDALCTVDCSHSGLTVSACVTALNKSSYVLPETLRLELIDIISHNATDEDLILHMPSLVHCIKYDSCPQVRRAKSPEEASQMGCPLSAFLLHRALSIDPAKESTVRLACEFYWRCICDGFNYLASLFLREMAVVSRAIADQLVELQSLSFALENRPDGSVLPRLTPLFKSRHMMVPFNATKTIRYIDSVSNTPKHNSPFFIKYNTEFEMPADAGAPPLEMIRTMKTLAYYNQDVHFALLLRHCLHLCRREFSHSADSDFSTLRIEIPALVCTSRIGGFSDILEPVVALRACASYQDMMSKLAQISDKKPEELVSQMKRSVAFFAALSYLTGFVFSDLVVNASGVVVSADLDMILFENYTPFCMVHHFFHAFAEDEEFINLSTKFFMKLRSLSSSIFMAFRVFFDAKNLTATQEEFGQQFTSHMSRYSMFDIPPLRAQKLYAAELQKIVKAPESQFEIFRKKTGEGLSSLWATISGVPNLVFGTAEQSGTSVEIKDEPVKAGHVDKAEAEVDGESAVAQDDDGAAAAATTTSSSGAFKLKP